MKNKHKSDIKEGKKTHKVIDWAEIIGNLEPVTLFNYQEKYFFKTSNVDKNDLE